MNRGVNFKISQGLHLVSYLNIFGLAFVQANCYLYLKCSNQIKKKFPDWSESYYQKAPAVVGPAIGI